MMSFVLDHRPGTPASLLESIQSEFSADVEQRFYLLVWLLETLGKNRREEADEIADLAFDAALEARLLPYFSVLEKVLTTRGMEIREGLRRRSPGELEKLVGGLLEED